MTNTTDSVKGYQIFLSPLYCEELKESQIPLRILASVVRCGILAHGVRLRGETAEETRLAEIAPYDGLTEKNFVIVKGTYLSDKYPQLLIEYYQRALKLVDGKKSEDEKAEDAAKACLLHHFNKLGIGAHQPEASPSPPMNGMRVDEAAEAEDVVDFGPRPTQEIDKYGLPRFYGRESSSSDTSDSDFV